MLQSKQRLLQLNAKLAETLTSKGVMATADETTTALVNKVAYITSGDDTLLRGLIQRDLTEIIIPDGVTSIGNYAFADCGNLTSIILPNSITSIGKQSFENCTKLEYVNLPNNTKTILFAAFRYCRSLTSVIIPNSVKSIDTGAFQGCTSLTSVIIPNSVTSIANNVFQGCSSLTSVTIENGFNVNNLNLSASTLYSRETIVSWLNALADRTGQTAYKLTIGATNLAKLTEQDILIATNKNWTLS